jgi:eukaryotic-like serine/threonine-protein kinase
VSLWSRLRARLRGGEGPEEDEIARDAPRDGTPPPETPPPAAPERGPTEIERLASVGQPGGPISSEAIAILRRLRGSIREAEALEAVLGAPGKLHDEVRVACAEMLAARGDEPRARLVLAKVTSTPGLILAADLWAAAGQLAKAAGTIERVLARDLDAPGARERHGRWRAALGFAPVTRRLDEATLVAAKPDTTTFRLLREVARGGAGTVYEAEDAVLGRRVAFKAYHGGAADRAVLSREARLAISLAGPGVIRLYDASPDEGWVAMEWVRRGSLRDLLATGTIDELWPPWPWLVPLARGIARVHERGVVHGDVKPANVLLRAPDDAILSDFGIARSVGDKAGGGSPGYMSPERLAGAAADPGDDIYGLGRVIEDVVVRVAADPRRFAGRAGDVAVEIERAERFVLACLAAPPERPADGAEVIRRLDSLVGAP